MSSHYRLQGAALSAAPPPREHFPGADDEPDSKKPAVGSPPPPTRFLKCICCFLVLLFILFVIAIVVYVLIYRPEEPEIKADYIFVSNLNLTNTSISGHFDLGFTAFNPNHVIQFRYENAEAYVFFKTGFIGSAKLADFKQETKHNTTVSTTITVDSAHLTARKINDINWEMANQGFVYFNVEVKADCWNLSPGLDDEKQTLTAKCDGLEVVMGPNSTYGTTRQDGYKHCQINL